MVSFSCEACNETVIKKKCQQHAQRCYGAVFTCIDCYQLFPGQLFKDHTSCITEAQKVEGKLYKPKTKKQQQQQPKKEQPKEQTKEEPKEELKKESKKDASKEELKKSKKESKSKKSKADDKLLSYVSLGDNLYKVMKKMAKADSKDIKEVLKKLNVTVGDDGKLVVSA